MPLILVTVLLGSSDRAIVVEIDPEEATLQHLKEQIIMRDKRAPSPTQQQLIRVANPGVAGDVDLLLRDTMTRRELGVTHGTILRVIYRDFSDEYKAKWLGV